MPTNNLNISTLENWLWEREVGDAALARELARKDRSLTRAYILEEHTWGEVRKSPVDLGDRLTTAVRDIAKENPDLKGVIDIVDYNATAAGQRILDDGNLARLMEILNRHRPGLRDVEPGDILPYCRVFVHQMDKSR